MARSLDKIMDALSASRRQKIEQRGHAFIEEQLTLQALMSADRKYPNDYIGHRWRIASASGLRVEPALQAECAAIA